MPVVFLSMGEMEQGQVDIVLRGRLPSGRSTPLDYTAVEALLANASQRGNQRGSFYDYTLHAPRFDFSASFLSLAQCSPPTTKPPTAAPTSSAPSLPTSMPPTTSTLQPAPSPTPIQYHSYGPVLPPSYFETGYGNATGGRSNVTRATLPPSPLLGPLQPWLESSSSALPPCWSAPGVRSSNAPCDWLYDGSEFCDASRSESGSKLGCFYTRCFDTKAVGADVLAIDIEREQRMELGRGWRYSPSKDALGASDVWLQEPLADQLSVSLGDYVVAIVDPYRAFGVQLWSSVLNASEADGGDGRHRLFVPFRVSRIYASGAGKYAASIQKAALINYTAWLPRASMYLSPRVSSARQARAARLRADENTPLVMLNLPADARLSAYIDSNVDRIQARISQFASRVAYALGFEDVHLQLPIVSSLSNVWAFSMLLGLLVDIITAVLVALTATLIYSLLAVNVETRAFELGVMRLVGAGRPRVLLLLVAQALAFALPAVIAGLLLAQALQVLVATAFSSLSGVEVDVRLSPPAVLAALALGLLMPLASAVAPIRAALRKQVLQALDARSRGAASSSAGGGGVALKIERAELPGASSSLFISWPLLLGGGMLAVFGFAIYYIMPLALLERNIELLLDIFVALLLGMLVGLTLFALNLAYMLQRLIILLLIHWWESTGARTLLVKNLFAHQLRNRKTMLMFSLSVGFIVFLSVAASAQLQLTSYERARDDGSVLLAVARRRWIRDREPYESIRDYYTLFLEAFADNHDVGMSVEPSSSSASSDPVPGDELDVQFAWMAASSFHWSGETVSISTLGGTASDSNIYLRGVSPNFFNATDPSFLDVDELLVDPPSPLTPSSLVDHLGRLLHVPNCTFLGTTYRQHLGLSIGDPYRMKIDQSSGLELQLNVCAFLRSAPSLKFSAFPNSLHQTILVSLPLYSSILQLSSSNAESDSSPPSPVSLDSLFMDKFFIRSSLAASGTPVNEETLDTLSMALYGASASAKSRRQDSVRIIDERTVDDEQAQQRGVTLGFFSFATLLCMIICFFSLLSSTYINIHEQRLEIGVLRAIGLSRFMLTRVFIEEAFVVVLSAALMGVVVGSVVGYTLTLQQGVFAEIPMPFSFPSELLAVVTGAALILAIFAAFFPMRSLLKNSPVSIIKSQ